MKQCIDIVGAGLAGSEAALQLAARGYRVRLFEMRPVTTTLVHHTDRFAELVCSNSLKSEKSDSAAGMLKDELGVLGSHLIELAHRARVAAGGALAVDRDVFADSVTDAIENNSSIEVVRAEVKEIRDDCLVVSDGSDLRTLPLSDAVIIASGPLTSDDFAAFIGERLGADTLAFFDAAAPIVMADSLDETILFRQSRYEEGVGDYLNAPFSREAYEHFIEELIAADRVIAKDFETKDLFQACQPIEEIARKGADAPRYGTMKPVGLVDPATGHRPWAAVQLRAEDEACQSYNLVGFQTNLTFGEQKRIFRMIPGLENAEFARYGVMHRNTFVDAPRVMNPDFSLRLTSSVPVFMCGQISGTEGYCEAMASGVLCARSVDSRFTSNGFTLPPKTTVTGSLFSYATSPDTYDYQPMHVNFGIIAPLDEKVKNKKKRYAAYAERGHAAIRSYAANVSPVAAK